MLVMLITFNSYAGEWTFKELVIYGASAGAIASLVHSYHFQNYFPKVENKFMFVDSPGLHFGESFWKKFDRDMIADFKETFTAIVLYNSFNDGTIARFMGYRQKLIARKIIFY